MSNFGVPTTEQLAKINKLAKRTLSADEVFVFPTKLAGDMIIPNRYVQLTKELLDVYAEDAKKGVSLLLDHSWSPDGFFGLGGRPKAAIPYGRTFDSRFEAGAEEGETYSLMGDHYMLRGVELDGIKTNDLAVSIEAGTLFDTSIGFGYDKAICSVCGENYRRCNHNAGVTYEIENEDGTTSQKLCYIKAKPPGFLMENSLVFDGAYPGAGVMSKAGDVFENENGIYQVVNDIKGIDPDKHMIATYSQKAGLTTLIKKSEHKKIFATGGIVPVPENKPLPSTGLDFVIPSNLANEISNALKNLKGVEKPMNEKLTTMLESFGIECKDGKMPDNILEQLAEKWDGVTETIKASVEPMKTAEGTFSATEYLGIPVKEISEKLGAETSSDEVLNLAKEGQEYRKQLIDDAMAMGVRAMGNDFPKETYETTFAAMGTKAIKDIMKTFESQAMSIPTGRQTKLDASGKPKNSIPDEAYRV